MISYLYKKYKQYKISDLLTLILILAAANKIIPYYIDDYFCKSRPDIYIDDPDTIRRKT